MSFQLFLYSTIDQSFLFIHQLRLYMGTLPVSSITVHYNKKSKVVTGHVQSFKITLQPQGPFNDTDLQSLKQTISLKSRINYRLIHRGNNTFGVLGFVPKGLCHVWLCIYSVLADLCVISVYWDYRAFV